MVIIMLLSLIILPFGVIAGTNTLAEDTSIDELIHQAREMELADKPAWLNLLHFKSTLSGGRESQADDKAFFLAENGSTNAAAELEASLHGFFSSKTSAHPRCLFPARYHWLDSQLGFADQLRDISCPQFDEWRKKLNSQSITLLFPSMHLDNPASMFGHTFIRFDRTDNNNLLSYTLSYAAAYDESDNVLLYSWKGITGGYPGRFYLQAFFETLQVYSDIEQRDIWEYSLNLNPQEIEQFIRHLWEVKGINFDYFFFRENCSFRLLALLDVARENMNMSIGSHPLYAVPVDTVRDIEKAGLISGRYYRPSAHNKVIQMSEQLGEEGFNAALLLTESTGNENTGGENTGSEKTEDKNTLTTSKIIQPYSAKQQSQILQLADELINQKKDKSAADTDLQFDILSTRSRLPALNDQEQFEFNSIPPELSHQSARWNISIGEREDEIFYEIGIRPVFHDLLDIQKGFIEGSSISVMDTQLRWYQQQEKLKLEKLDFFSLKSIISVRPWSSPISRKISFKLQQRDLSLNEQIIEFETQFSFGYALEIKKLLAYAMLNTQLNYAPELKNNHGLYLGGDVGALWSFENRLMTGKMELNYQNLQRLSGEPGDVKKTYLGLQLDIETDQALRIEFNTVRYEMFDVGQLSLSYLKYF